MLFKGDRMKVFSIALLAVLPIKAMIIKGDVHRHKLTHVTGTSIIDGRNPGINADIMLNLLRVIDMIKKILFGEKQAGVLIKQHQYKDTFVSLDDLVAIFEDLEQQGIFNGTEYEDAIKCLNSMKAEFAKLSETLLGQEAAFIQKITIKIIHNWAHKSDRNNSILLRWGNEDEKEMLRSLSAHQFKDMCIDLKTFLYDLIASCPIAREEFKKKYITPERYGQQFQTKRDAFDHAFTIE